MVTYAVNKVAEALRALHLKRGDILIIDARVIDPDALHGLQLPEVDFAVPIICAYPHSGSTVSEALHTCDLETLKQVVYDMEHQERMQAKHGEATKEQSPAPGA